MTTHVLEHLDRSVRRPLRVVDKQNEREPRAAFDYEARHGVEQPRSFGLSGREMRDWDDGGALRHIWSDFHQLARMLFDEIAGVGRDRKWHELR